MTATPRTAALAALRGEKPLPRPVFSGLPSLAAPALAAAGLRFNESHTASDPMARAAASTFEMFGFGSAVVPFDLCVEAEALGCGLDFQTEVDAFLAPVVQSPLNVTAALEHLALPADVARLGRIPVVAGALTALARRVGSQVVLGACLPGPFTLAWQMFGADAWLSALRDEARVAALLARLAGLLARVGRHYRGAGADFVTIHEMGGSPQVIGPAAFRALVKPALRELLGQLEEPKVLSVCGDTNAVVADLAECGADALSVDQRNDLARTRRLLPQAVLFGNFDPLAVLSHGTPEAIAESVHTIVRAGADAVWPGCDLWPEIPEANFRALMSAAEDVPA
jgi:[methyl-Co(III) methanol-specific corrinoid protein]:coenzyme M methyltransferase